MTRRNNGVKNAEVETQGWSSENIIHHMTLGARLCRRRMSIYGIELEELELEGGNNDVFCCVVCTVHRVVVLVALLSCCLAKLVLGSAL